MRIISSQIFTYLLISFFGLFAALHVSAQNSLTVTKCSNAAFFVNGSTQNSSPVTFVSGVDFPANYALTKIVVTVNWSRNQIGCGGAAGLDNSSEIGFNIQGPGGNQRSLVSPADWSGTGIVNNITTIFQDAAASVVGFPVSGTFNPSQSISSILPSGTDFLGIAPFGNWELVAIDQNSNLSGICINSVCITITACPNNVTAICQPTLNLYLDNAGNASPDFNLLNNGSDTSCFLQNVSFSPAGPFNCSNTTAPISTIMTITDKLGNSSSCTSLITVLDTIKPSAICKSYVQLYLDNTGNVTMPASLVDSLSSDNCALNSAFTLVNNLSSINFACNQVFNPIPLVLSVRDVNGNTAQCNTIAYIRDTIKPVANCVPSIVLNLSSIAPANVSLNAIQVNNSSTDNCTSNPVLSINGQSQINFTCANLGLNQLILLAQDPSGNTDTCISQVTIQDITAPLANCQSSLTVFLDNTGTQTLNAIQLDNGSTDNCAIVDYEVAGSSTVQFNCNQLGGNVVTLTIRDGSGNQSSCTSIVQVRDSIRPAANCFTTPRTVYLNNTGVVNVNATLLDSLSDDNCTVAQLLINNQNTLTFNCTQTGVNNVQLTVIDSSNNINTCSASITVVDSIAPVANCQSITVNLDPINGLAIVQSIDINANSTDNCSLLNILINGQLRDTFNCTNIGPNLTTLSITDVNGNQNQCTATVTIIDNVSPVLTCNNRTTYINNAGLAAVQPQELATAIDICGIVQYTVDHLNTRVYNCNQVGFTFADTVRAYDASGNMGYCISLVQVADTTSPIARCQNINLFLNAQGIATLTPSQIDLSSNDNCQINNYLINNSNVLNFNCNDVGLNQITLRVVDPSGNSSTCISDVQVIDNVNPVANCQNLNLVLSATGTISIPAINLNGTPVSSDACGPLIFTVAGQSNLNLNCSNVGSNNIVLEVTDQNGNRSTCTSIITVRENIPPVINCRNYTLHLDPNGVGIVNSNQVVDVQNSYDNCGFISYTLNSAPQLVFNCTQLGNSSIRVIGSDASGNRDTCFSIVTVIDTVAPTISCNDIIINLALQGTHNLNAAQLGVVTLDACGIDTTIITPSLINCSNVGINLIQITTYDINGNMSVCESEVNAFLQDPQLSAFDSVLCEGQTLALFPNPPASGLTYTYSWAGPNGFNSSLPFPQVINMQLVNEGIYRVTLTPQGAPGCILRDSIYIDVNVVPAPILFVNNPICTGDSVVIHLTNHLLYSGNQITYQWYFDGVLQSQVQDSIYVLNPVDTSDQGNYDLTVTVDGCIDSTSQPLNLSVFNLPADFTAQYRPNCEGDSLFLFSNPPVGIVSYQWTGPNSFSSVLQNPIIFSSTLANQGQYIVTVSDINTCKSIDTIQVLVKPRPVNPSLTYNSPLCADDILILSDTVLRNGLFNYIWADSLSTIDTTNLSSLAIPVWSEGSYSLFVEQNGCTSDTILLNVVQEPVSYADFDVFNMAFRDSVFSLNVTLNDILRPGFIISIVDSTKFGALTLNTDGTFNYKPGWIFQGVDTFTYKICDPLCPNVCSQTFVAIQVEMSDKCFIPNAFSPNGDGINDQMVVVCKDLLPNLEMQIFSRWGNLVFKGNPDGWNGQFNGKDLPDGTYFYTLDYGDGSKLESGYIIIYR